MPHDQGRMETQKTSKTLRFIAYVMSPMIDVESALGGDDKKAVPPAKNEHKKLPKHN